MANSPQTYPRRIPAGMVAAYNWTHADARDTSWNGNDGTFYGGTANEGIATFDGVTQHVRTPAYTIGTDPIAASIWVRAHDYGGGCALKIGSGNFGGLTTFDGLQIFFNTDHSISGSFRQTSIVNADFVALGTYISNAWVHILLQVDPVGLTIDIYTDSVLQDSTDITAVSGYNLPGVNNNIIAGRWSTAGIIINNFDGDIGSTRIYNRALSAQEISDIYNNERGFYI